MYVRVYWQDVWPMAQLAKRSASSFPSEWGSLLFVCAATFSSVMRGSVDTVWYKCLTSCLFGIDWHHDSRACFSPNIVAYRSAYCESVTITHLSSGCSFRCCAMTSHAFKIAYDYSLLLWSLIFLKCLRHKEVISFLIVSKPDPAKPLVFLLFTPQACKWSNTKTNPTLPSVLDES